MWKGSSRSLSSCFLSSSPISPSISFQVYAMELAGQRVMHDLRMKVFSHVQNLSVSFFDKNPVGRLVTRLTNDIQNIHEMFTSVLVYLLKDIVLLVGIIVRPPSL